MAALASRPDAPWPQLVCDDRPDILSWHELVTSAAAVSGLGESTNQGGGIYTVGQTFVSPLQADSGTKSTGQKSNILTQYNSGWGYESMS